MLSEKMEKAINKQINGILILRATAVAALLSAVFSGANRSDAGDQSQRRENAPVQLPGTV